MDRRLLYCRMRRRAVVPYATATSGQPLPYLPLPMARTGVPADEGRTALPIFQTGTRREGVLCGFAPTLYSSQVQQQARIPAHYGEPLRTNEPLLTWPYAAVHGRVPVSGGQGVAGSNPAVPTVFRTLLRHVQQQYSSTRGRLLRSVCGLSVADIRSADSRSRRWAGVDLRPACYAFSRGP
jgi:hypothetical protein